MEERWASLFHPCKTPNLHLLPLHLLFFILLLSPPTHSQSAPDGHNATTYPPGLHAGDRASLLSFKSWLDDPNQTLSTWVGSNCTNWTGITCFAPTGHVAAVNLTRTNLSGQIHPSLCNLSYVETLILSHNNFNGSIPACFGSFRHLKTLDLGYNQLRGDVPMTLEKLGNLGKLILSGNVELGGGGIPVWIGNFSSVIEKLDLGFSSFGGEIPESLLFSQSMKYIDLGKQSSLRKSSQFSSSFGVLEFGLQWVFRHFALLIGLCSVAQRSEFSEQFHCRRNTDVHFVASSFAASQSVVQSVKLRDFSEIRLLRKASRLGPEFQWLVWSSPERNRGDDGEIGACSSRFIAQSILWRNPIEDYGVEKLAGIVSLSQSSHRRNPGEDRKLDVPPSGRPLSQLVIGFDSFEHRWVFSATCTDTQQQQSFRRNSTGARRLE
ncbi:hypothetical protein L1049_021054 [Liquidambar formosana]|uniref:Leucine-rich repeat-containing N-terminal plant-type domain-containing protein n=1 Tax=Liquidambar formosana TaxID=63359 RepID=A0AAP0S971_LIQFO